MNFQLLFHKYKITDTTLKSLPDVGILAADPPFPHASWSFSLSIRVPQYFPRQQRYITGLDIKAELELDPDSPGYSDVESTILVEAQAGILGIFSLTAPEENRSEFSRILVVNANAILLPILRGALTQTLAVSGFGSPLFPVTNITSVAEQLFKGKWPEIAEIPEPYTQQLTSDLSI